LPHPPLPSSTATCISPKERPSATTPKPTAQRYFVTDSGITVVTRDYSLFENPVTVDYFTSEYGKIDEKCWSAVVTRRGENIRLISVRRSREEEVTIYESEDI
jgi:hypothetical protein